MQTQMSGKLCKVKLWFLSRQKLTTKKLQILLYYAQAWTIALENEPGEAITNKLFDEKFEAWPCGPVIPVVFERYKQYDILYKYHSNVQFDEDIEDILQQVLDIYGNYTDDELENIVCQEDPWILARNGFKSLKVFHHEILEKDMFEYYIQQMNYK